MALLPLLLASPASAQRNWLLIPAPGSAAEQAPAAVAPAIPLTATSFSQARPAQPRPTKPAFPLPAEAPSLASVSSAAVTTSSIAAAPGPTSNPQPRRLSQAATPPAGSASTGSEPSKSLRESLRIPPLVKREKAWPSPSLSPGVPSAFIANWGDVFVGISGATSGKQRPDADGSWNAGFGLGDAAKAVAVEISGGCGSFKRFCGNGSFTGRIGRLLVNQPKARVSIAGAWQNFAQWGYEGRQDNIFYGALSYALPLRPPGSGFGQTLQFNAGVGNSAYAPFTATNSQSAVGGFGSVGIELSPAVGVSAGWSGRGANAQLSYTPFRDVPITLNVLGADLFNQTPAGTVAVFSVSWGRNFTTPSF